MSLFNLYQSLDERNQAEMVVDAILVSPCHSFPDQKPSFLSLTFTAAFRVSKGLDSSLLTTRHFLIVVRMMKSLIWMGRW
jgi:hypothetical protein